MCKIQYMTRNWVFPLLLLFLGVYFFTYALGNVSLMPWDEAWYATISKEIIQNGHPLLLTFNHTPYYDHPPLGFYSISISYLLLGISEFSARLPMAIFGSLAVLVTYLLGKRLSGSWTGLAAGLVLLSCRWFVIRSRTANLEALLIFTQILAVYFFYRPDRWWKLALGWLSLSLALLSKSVISITLLPLALWSTFAFLRHNQQRAKTILISLIVFILPLLPWYLANYHEYGRGFILQNVVSIGTRGASTQGVDLQTTQRTLLYLRSAIHKWYLPLLAACVLSLVYIRRYQVRWLLAYLFLSAFPYFLSSQTQIWHLLPILPPAALLIAYIGRSLPIPKIVYIIGFWLIFAISFNSYWPEFVDQKPFVTFEAQVGLAAKQNGLPVVSQETTYIPTLVFYSNLPVDTKPIQVDLNDYPRPFQLVTHTYLLDPRLKAVASHQLGDTLVAVVD